MKRLIAVCLLISMKCYSQEFSTGLTHHQVNLTFSGFSIKEDTLLSRGVGTILEGDILYGVDPSLQLHFSPVASFVSGEQTSRDPLSPLTNSIYLKEASLAQVLGYGASVKAGVLYQKEFLPGIAGFTKAFPGIGILAPLKFDRHLIELKGQAAVPASSGLASTSSQLESSASLFSGTINFRTQWLASLSTVVSLSHYTFNRLSAGAAADSISKGNSIRDISKETKTFIYKYDGNEIALGFDYKDDNFILNFLSSFVKNDSAPKNLNQGYFISFSPGLIFRAHSIIHPIIEHYHVESDAMVASYSDTTYGRMNRDGFRYGLGLDSAKYKVSIIYANSKLIQTTPYQYPDKSYFLNFSLENLF